MSNRSTAMTTQQLRGNYFLSTDTANLHLIKLSVNTASVTALTKTHVVVKSKYMYRMNQLV